MGHHGKKKNPWDYSHVISHVIQSWIREKNSKSMAYTRSLSRSEENSPKLSKDTFIWIQEAQRTPNRQDQKINPHGV